jgi:hypothetical protein
LTDRPHPAGLGGDDGVGVSRSAVADGVEPDARIAAVERLGATPLVDRVRLLAQRGRLDLTESTGPAVVEVDPLRGLGISAREAEVLRVLGLGRTNQ